MVSHLNTLIQSVVIDPHTIDPVFGGIQRNPPSSSPDGTATLTSGEKVYGPRSLRKVLLGKKDLFTINLSEKLLTYGTGRKTTIEDQTEAREIAEKRRETVLFSILIAEKRPDTSKR